MKESWMKGELIQALCSWAPALDGEVFRVRYHGEWEDLFAGEIAGRADGPEGECPEDIVIPDWYWDI